VAVVPSVAVKLVKLGANGAGDAIKLTDAAFKNVAFTDDRKELVGRGDRVAASTTSRPATPNLRNQFIGVEITSGRLGSRRANSPSRSVKKRKPPLAGKRRAVLSIGETSKIDDAEPGGMRDGVGAADRVELVEQRADMELGGVDGDAKPAGDHLV
jgi:hypothetical protein